MATLVPPAVGPLAGTSDARTGGGSTVGGGGGATKVKAAASVEAWPSGFVTVTSTAPAACGGETTERAVALEAVTWAGTPPSETDAPAWKLAPETTSAVPPTVEPLGGATLAIAGGGGGGAT